jgi:hypothetical protein
MNRESLGDLAISDIALGEPFQIRNNDEVLGVHRLSGFAGLFSLASSLSNSGPSSRFSSRSFEFTVFVASASPRYGSSVSSFPLVLVPIRGVLHFKSAPSSLPLRACHIASSQMAASFFSSSFGFESLSCPLSRRSAPSIDRLCVEGLRRTVP